MHFVTVVVYGCCLIFISLSASSGVNARRQKRASSPLHWDYTQVKGKMAWDVNFPMCATGEQQSPIALMTSQARYSSDLSPVDLTFGDLKSQSQNPPPQYLSNNGHSVSLNFSATYMTGANLPDVFSIVNAHFHWGSDSNVGSEHTLDGVRYPLELHVVFYDSQRFASFSESLKGPDSIAVLGFFFKISPNDNPLLTPVISALPPIMSGGRTPMASNLDLKALLNAVKPNFYFRYDGSLTTPPCNEVVLWTVFGTPLEVSEAQLAQFRKVMYLSPAGSQVSMSNNWRPLQQLNGRVVTRSFFADGELTDPDTLTSTSAAPALASLVALTLTVTFFTLSAHLFRK